MNDLTDKDTFEEIESEGNEQVSHEVPFNPNDISVSIVPRTVGQLVDMLEYDEIIIPSYQRLPNLWDDKKKSRFIESLMLNLPIPLFYFDEGEDKKWKVIDGLQRISTLEHFILAGKKQNTLSQTVSPLVLRELEFKTEFNDYTWDKLPREIQRRIATNQVTINLIGKGTPDIVKYNIFSRINQGGIVLTAQEIRSALFQGYRLNFLEKLVSENTFTGQAFWKATDYSVPVKRQEDLDFATRFISFYLLGHKNYEPDMDYFLTQGTKAIPNEEVSQREIRDRFKQAMNIAYSVFGNNAFRKLNPENTRRSLINKPLFELVSVFFAKIDSSDIQNFIEKKDEFLQDFLQTQNEPLFFRSITSATATKDAVRNRFLEFKKLMTKYFNSFEND